MSAPDFVNIVSPPGWMAEALCAQVDPELFFPEKGGSTREAKQVCLACPVRAECLDYALTEGEEFGIWGGQSERGRRAQITREHPQRRARTEYGQRVAQVRRAAASGLTNEQIASQVGCTERTVLRIRRDHGIPLARVAGNRRGVA